MPVFSSPAILLRRMDYGDFDVIITFFTLQRGKLSLIAKAAKKSTKRFAGILELFSVLEVVAGTGRGQGLPVLQEAVLKQPFSAIRADFRKTAFASYWAELIYNWIEENYRQDELYYLFEHVLTELDKGHTPQAALNILFQMRFLTLSGHLPNLTACSICRKKLDGIQQATIIIDLQRGGIVCGDCSSNSASRLKLGKGTIKELLWTAGGNLDKAARIKFSSTALQESTHFLEEFVSYHLGKQPRSLKFLRQIRD
ncbi:MAG: DNA repair protein RecO [Desulfobacterales bacterium]|jgi:DNA repair protein RecO (recombination protein O)